MVRALTSVCAVGALLAAAGPALAQAGGDRDADEAAIRATALDYIEGWYTQDAARMERALHSELVKRMAFTDPQSGSVLDQGSGLRLVQATRPAPGETPQPAGDRQRDVTILDLYGGAASVKIDADGWVDYLHLVKWNGEWKILNVLWELDPEGLP